MVFIALPTLQRSQRDTQRRNDLAKLDSQIVQYQSNNNGRLPAGNCIGDDAGTVDGNTGKYSLPSGTSKACELIKNYIVGRNSSEDTFRDPSGPAYELEFKAYTNDIDGNNATTLPEYRIQVITGGKCDGEKVINAGNKRGYAIIYRLETGVFCQDNA